MKILKINKKSLLKGLRDVAILILVVYGISLWQARHLLDDDGSIEINDLQLVSLQGNVTPVFEQNKRTLIYFFAPWCSICKVSINNLDYLD
ncbi:TlpA family protein disulfide reductase, partial [Aliiglaciecola sp.]|nr:TlpA family protein disulfide reductase [Aliiglaciecola sp.]